MTEGKLTALEQRREELRKARASPEGKGKISGLSTWKDVATNPRGIKGASTKKARWSEYYDMYRQHAFVRASIDKVAKTATNAGYDFVPRDSRSEIKDSEVAILKEFFSNQDDFIYELRRIYKDMLIYGDAYLYVIPDRRRRPVRLKRLPPQTIHIKATRTGHIEGYYQKNLNDISDEVVRFDPHELLHFRIDDPDNDLYGLSPLESLKWAVAADLYAQRYNAAFFQNSGVSGTIIAVKNADPAEIQRNRRWLEENYTGPEAAHKPIVIEGESITVEKSVATHQEMGFLEGRRFIILEILAVLDVPPAKIGIMESANRSNSKEQDKTFRTESVSPLQNIVQSVINDQFIRKILGVENTIFVHSEGDTRDAIEQMDYYTKGQAWGIFNPNEIRRKLGMADVDGGDTNGIMTPTGFVPLDRLDLYFQLPKQNIETIPETKRDPAAGEPMPRRRKTVVTGQSHPVTKSLPTSLSLQGALIKMSEAFVSENSLRQAYSYLCDIEDQDMRIINAREALSKACRSDDDVLRRGYIERAHEALGQFIQPISDHIEHAQDLRKKFDEEEALLDEEDID